AVAVIGYDKRDTPEARANREEVRRRAVARIKGTDRVRVDGSAGHGPGIRRRGARPRDGARPWRRRRHGRPRADPVSR
ncbi:hypothetical protein, partial [Actinomadura sp. NPDC000929]|uniref:hypothetical protein n=1 Tax=Actinomadura sp. NPDC000929 TaxID=3154517 RepID=UPI00339B837E